MLSGHACTRIISLIFMAFIVEVGIDIPIDHIVCGVPVVTTLNNLIDETAAINLAIMRKR